MSSPERSATAVVLDGIRKTLHKELVEQSTAIDALVAELMYPPCPEFVANAALAAHQGLSIV